MATERRAALGPLTAAVAALLAAGAVAGGTGYWRAQRADVVTEEEVAEGPAPTLDELLGIEDQPEHPLFSVFHDRLPEYVVALDARSAGAERAAPDDVASTRARALALLAERDASLVEPTTALFDAAERYVDITDDDDDDAGVLLNRLVRFQDALAERNVPYFVDAELGLQGAQRQRVLLSMFTVKARRTFRAGDAQVLQLDIDRLDNLSFERSLLGYTRPEVRYALVRVDRIERFLIEKVLPSVHSPNDSVIVRDYQDETGIGWVTSFEEHAHEDLRTEAALLTSEALGPTSTALADLAAAIVQRRNGVRAVSHSLRTAGVRIREPPRYVFDVAQLQNFHHLDLAGLAAIREAEHALRSEAALSAYGIVADGFTRSVAEHEVQHRLDYEADRLAHVPEVLSQYVGETDSEDRVNRRAERANAELSAYLSQIAQRPAMSRTSLIHVASFVMDRNAWRMPEAYAAVALFEALAETLGLDHAPLIAHRRIQRAEIARIYAAARRLGGDGLSDLAARTWSRIYEAPLPRIERVD